MPQKFISLADAAKQLGVSVDRLNQLREAGKARAFRDGAGWKFKEEEVQRISSEVLTAGQEQDSGDEDVRDMEPEPLELEPEESESILLNEADLGESESGSSSTIIGKEDEDDEPASEQDSDLELSSEPGKEDAADDGSEIVLELEGGDTNTGDDLGLDVDGSHVFSEDAGGSGVLESAETDPGSRFEDLDVLDIDLESEASQIGSASSKPPQETAPSETPPPADTEGDSSLILEDQGSEVQGSETETEREEEKKEQEQPASVAAQEPPAANKSEPEDSSIDLADDEDDELVLGEGSGSDITLSSEQSGIQLVDASDTGIALDDVPLELGGSSAESPPADSDESLSLAEDSKTKAEPESEPDIEDSVVLSAMGESRDSSQDSGSQVVALDLEESEFDETGATMLGGESALGSGIDFGSGAMSSGIGSQLELPAGESAPSMLDEESTASAAAAPAAAPAATAAGPVVAQGQYSAWNLVFLGICCLLLLLCGFMMFDLLRSIWSWKEPFALNSALMDAILKAFP